MNLGENIKQFRRVRHLTQSELSQEIGIPRATLQKYESGTIQNVPLPTIEAIGSVLDVPPAELVGWHSYDPNLACIIDGYHMLDDEDRRLVIELIERLK